MFDPLIFWMYNNCENLLSNGLEHEKNFIGIYVGSYTYGSIFLDIYLSVQYFSVDRWQQFLVTLPKQCTENAYAFFLGLHVIVFRFLLDVCALCCLESRDVLVGISISLCLFLQTYFRVLICCNKWSLLVNQNCILCCWCFILLPLY